MSKKDWNVLNKLLHQEIISGIASFNFLSMTPVQAATIPLLLGQKDVAVEAVTGSGKTLAFLIPVLQILKRSREEHDNWKNNKVGALILSPTRELALQTKDVLQILLKHVKGLTSILFVGGNNLEEDVKMFRENGGNIIIATPGRFEDLLQRSTGINLTQNIKSLEVLILDEADKLLDLGFQSTINTILSYLPKQRRTGLFSATQTKEVQDLIRAGLRNPVIVSITEKAAQKTPSTLNNYYIECKSNGKLATLMLFLEQKNIKKGILFLPTCACVDFWASVIHLILPKNINLPIFALHGKMKQKRHNILEKFRNSENGLILCTDIIARGIDIPEIDWVLQWDPPTSANAFVHRVGRTARQNNSGSALILLLPNEVPYVQFIKKNQNVNLIKLEDLSDETKIEELTNSIRNIKLKDRDIMEKGVRAFVSHIRAYSKNECSILLRVKDLPLSDVAFTYGLLQLPKMPELKHQDVSNFKSLPDLDLNSIPYKNIIREKLRLTKLKSFKETGVWPDQKLRKSKKATEPWSKSKQFKEERKTKRKKRKMLKEINSAGTQNKNKRKDLQMEYEELSKDLADLKKFKKKKLSEAEFEKKFGI